MAGRDLENKNKPEKQGEALSYTTQYIKSQRKKQNKKNKQKDIARHIGLAQYRHAETPRTKVTGGSRYLEGKHDVTRMYTRL